MPSAETNPETKIVSLFRNGRNQALRVPRAFVLPGKEVMVHREAGRLIIEPVPQKAGLLSVLAGLKPLKEEFPNVDAALMPLDDIQL